MVEVRFTRPTLLGGSAVGYLMATAASTTFHSAIRAITPSKHLGQPCPARYETRDGSDEPADWTAESPQLFCPPLRPCTYSSRYHTTPLLTDRYGGKKLTLMKR